jgi:GTPase
MNDHHQHLVALRDVLHKDFILEIIHIIGAYVGAYSFDCRIAMMGHVDAGKSTLTGVLTRGILDNSRGLARAHVFAHKHESDTGRTSSVTHHLIGYDATGKQIYQTCKASAGHEPKNKSWRHIMDISASHLTLIDLAGHEHYLRNSIAGLISNHVHYTIVVLNATKGIEKMTREHIKVLCSIGVPFACVWTKIDMVTKDTMYAHASQLKKLLGSEGCGKRIMMEIRAKSDMDWIGDNYNSMYRRLSPVFRVSSVTGVGLDLLHNFLYRMSICADLVDKQQTTLHQPLLMDIQEIWKVPYVGLVASVHIFQGTLMEDMNVVVGPFEDDSFRDATIKSIEYKRLPVKSCTAGQSCTVAFRTKDFDRDGIRRGMAVMDRDRPRTPVCEFYADIFILHHPTTIKRGYQAMIHCNSVRQVASIEEVLSDKTEKTESEKDKSDNIKSEKCLRSGSRAHVRIRFMQRSECVQVGSLFLFREGHARGIGKIIPKP